VEVALLVLEMDEVQLGSVDAVGSRSLVICPLRRSGAREGWQMDQLIAPSLALLEMVDEDSRLDWDVVPPFLPPNGSPAVGAVRQLEARLLVHTSEVHTPSGATITLGSRTLLRRSWTQSLV
jgi:hypothetical protein